MSSSIADVTEKRNPGILVTSHRMSHQCDASAKEVNKKLERIKPGISRRDWKTLIFVKISGMLTTALVICIFKS